MPAEVVDETGDLVSHFSRFSHRASKYVAVFSLQVPIICFIIATQSYIQTSCDTYNKDANIT